MGSNVHAIRRDDAALADVDPEILRLAEGVHSAEATLSEKIEQRDRLDREIAVLTKALAAHRPDAPKRRASSASVKGAVLSMLEERGSYGLNAGIACDLAAARGRPLKSPSVSSLLSRLKADNVVTYDGYVYRLKGCPSDPSPSRVGER